MLPAGLTENDKVVLFDGVCKLCSGWAKFLIHYDSKQVIKLATVQSKSGQDILKFYGLGIESYDTMVFIENGQHHVQSDAFFAVIKYLPQPWPLLRLFSIIPRSIRNWLYDRIALNRYFLFGKHSTCLLPTADHLERFLRDS